MVYTSEYTSKEYLHINSCDCQRIIGIDNGSFRENGRKDYQLIFVAQGNCYIYENDIEICVPEGSVILYRPYEKQHYMYKKEWKNTSYYVHFSGTGCKNLLEELGFTERYYYVGEIPIAEELFKKMIYEFFINKDYSNLACNGYLQTILALYGRYKSTTNQHPTTYDVRIEDVCRTIIHNIDRPINVGLLAQKYNISTSRFIHLFKESTGISLKKFLLKIRIKKACELLTSSDMSVAAIGESVGIFDQNYFSRVFKKYTSKSPIEYKNSSWHSIDDFNFKNKTD